MSKISFYSKVVFTICTLSMHYAEAATRVVNSTSDNAATVGTLPYWIINGTSGDLLDCSLINGQVITLTSSFPAITKDYEIIGAGITIDGANSYQAFQVASGSSIIHNITIQNALSKGGDGGDGYSGGGGAVGGGGAIYVHGGASATLTTSSLTNNVAQGGDGGSANNNGNAGAGGGGGYGGGNGGSCLNIVSTGGGGGGHSNGGDGGSSSSVNGSNGVYYGGAGGGAGINAVATGGTGGNAGPFTGGAQSNGNGGGGAGNSQNGFSAAGSGSSGIPGNGGNGIGTDFAFGCGGGGGCASESGFSGGTGVGAAGGGGGANFFGGTGGLLGGGGGGGLGAPGGNGGFGSGGGGAIAGGLGGGGFNAGGGNGGSDPSANGAGGGGSGLGGAIFIQSGGQLTLVDAVAISNNNVIAGVGGTSNTSDPSYIPAQDGAAMGYDIFVREQGSIIFDLSNSLTLTNPIEGDINNTLLTSGGLQKLGSGTLTLTGANTYSGITTISDGTLHLTGSIAGKVEVNLGGTLSGTGTVTLGELSVNSGLVKVSPSTLISVTGAASLSGVLEISLDSITPSGSYILLTSTGLTGMFDSVTFTGPTPVYTLSYLPQGNPTYVQLNLVGDPLSPPTNLQGKQKRNDFALEYELYNQLTWTASSSLDVSGYNIYRNGLKIATVSASTLTYSDHNRKKGVSYAYAITAFDSSGNESAPLNIVITP